MIRLYMLQHCEVQNEHNTFYLASKRLAWNNYKLYKLLSVILWDYLFRNTIGK